MLGFTSRQFRILVLILALFAIANYFLLIPTCPPAIHPEPLDHREPEKPIPKSSNDNIVDSEWSRDNITHIEWESHKIPETIAIQKVPGSTMFKNLYIYRGVLYIVTRRPETIPLTRFMISNGLNLEDIEDNEPTSDTISIITPEEAEELFGNTASLLDGVSFMQTDSPQFLHHMYHFVVEIFALWHWRYYTSVDLDQLFNGHHRPLPRRWLFPHAYRQDWQDKAGMNLYVLRAALGGMSLEFKDDWEYRKDLDRPFVFEYALLGDRASWHRGPFWKVPGTVFPITTREDFWKPMRESVITFASKPIRETQSKPENVPVITYISRQKTSRRLLKEHHEALVSELKTLGDQYGYEINIPIMEETDKNAQLELLGRTNILLGVHGNGLSGQIWLKPTPRTTVIEIFYPEGFLYDYEYTARSLGHKYYGFWSEKYFTWPNIPPLRDPEGFHGPNIPCNASAIVSLIHRRLSLDDPSLA